MNLFYRLRGLALLMAVLMLDPGATLFARNRKGDKLYKQAQQAEAKKDWDKALELYEEALSQDPSDPAYDMGARRARFQVSEIHTGAAKKLRDSGKLEEALVEYQKAFAIDPANALALQEIQRTTEMINQKKKGNVKPGEESLTPAEKARKDAEERMSSILPLPTLKPVTNFISYLKLNNQPTKVLYETVGKYAGVNVIFDAQMQAPTGGKGINVEISNNTVDQAFDYLGLLTKTYWKPVTPNTIFVTDDNVTKKRDYQDQVVKTFYLKNVTSTQEFQEIVVAVRSVTDIRRMFPFNAQNAVICRGTADQIALAEKLFHDLDKAKAEVVVDFVVMEANSDRTRDISMTLASGSTNGLSLPIGFTPRNPVLLGNSTGSTGTTGTTTTGTTTTGTTTTGTTTTGTTPTGTGTTGLGSTGIGTGLGGYGGTSTGTPAQNYVSLGQIGKIGFNDFSISLPNALLQAVMTDNTTRVLQKPQVRASDGQKVTLKIGDKIPYATGSFQPGFAGSVGGVSPLVSTQFQFAETGVNVEVTPHVHGSDEVTLHVLIDISNVSQQITIGGLQQPVISQRKSEADIRLRDGEVNILGGLTQVQDTKSISGLPGITYVPVLGHLFGDHNTDKQHRELLIALIPHIVRTPDITPLDTAEIAAGTEQDVKLNFAEPMETPTEPAKPAVPVKPGVPEATVPSAPTLPSTSAAPGPSGIPVLSLVPSTVQVALSAPVVETLNVQNITDLVSAGPVHLQWDPRLLRLNDVSQGDLMKSDGQNPPIIDIRNDSGDATIIVSRVTGAAGVSGTGSLAKLTFMAIGKGTGSIMISDASLKDSKGQAIPVSTATVPVTV